MWRAETILDLPEARVIGAVPANPRRPAMSLKRAGSSPSSPRRRAPRTVPMPGTLVMIAAYLWQANKTLSWSCRALIAPLIAAMMSRSPAAATPRACSTSAGWRMVS